MLNMVNGKIRNKPSWLEEENYHPLRVTLTTIYRSFEEIIKEGQRRGSILTDDKKRDLLKKCIVNSVMFYFQYWVNIVGKRFAFEKQGKDQLFSSMT